MKIDPLFKNISKTGLQEASDLALEIGALINGKNADVVMLAMQSVWGIVCKMVEDEK